MLGPMEEMIRLREVFHRFSEIGDRFASAQREFAFKAKLRHRQGQRQLQPNLSPAHTGASHMPSEARRFTVNRKSLPGLLLGRRTEKIHAQIVTCDARHSILPVAVDP